MWFNTVVWNYPLYQYTSKCAKNFLIPPTFPSSALPHVRTLPSRWGFCSASTILPFILASPLTLFALGYWVTDVRGKQITNGCCNQHEWRKQPLSCRVQHYSDSDALWPAFWCMYFCGLICEVVVNSASSFLFCIYYLINCAYTFNATGFDSQSNIGKTVRLREPGKSKETNDPEQLDRFLRLYYNHETCLGS